MAASCHTLLQLVAVLLLFTTTLAQLTGNFTDGRGISYCNKCGNITDTDLPAANISQCVLEKADSTDIKNSIFACQCRTHFVGDGITCNDVDECEDRIDNCDSHAICKNTVGSFECYCDQGYRGTGIVCGDIDECAEAGSEKNASDTYCNGRGICNNIDGSYECKCDKGYVAGENGTSCVDNNECDRDNTCEQQCVNNIGSYFCTCYSGFEPKNPSAPGKDCVDINECETLEAPCGRNSHCVNGVGNYSCECDSGFEWEQGPFIRHCVDIDECALETKLICNVYLNTECRNTYGSAECACKEGFRGPKTNCTNINECDENSSKCSPHADCHDDVGSYTCTCKQGFTGNGTYCTDINECLNALDNKCDKNAICNNMDGTYNCSCIYGYQGDGLSCSVKAYNGRDIEKEGDRISRSALLFQYQSLDHERLQLELEHEKLLRRCADQLQAKRLQGQRARREVIDVDTKAAESLQTMIIVLKKQNADLEVENHALSITCP
ncbi:fibrillin-1-like [Watersipora subatra]|uniref:fibrillin-1-like n=1 Tax=Watersipora subatra TaxID=2589382 RepID=UPI00355AD528